MLKPPLVLIISNWVCVYMICVCPYVPEHVCRMQRAIWSCQFSLHFYMDSVNQINKACITSPFIHWAKLLVYSYIFFCSVLSSFSFILSFFIPSVVSLPSAPPSIIPPCTFSFLQIRSPSFLLPSEKIRPSRNINQIQHNKLLGSQALILTTRLHEATQEEEKSPKGRPKRQRQPPVLLLFCF